MNILIHIFLFLVVLFLYIHITTQWKKSEDLEVYEMDYTTNTYLQEVCDIKQPVSFNYNSINPTFFEKVNDETIEDLGGRYDVKVKENNDYLNESIESVDYIVLPFQSSQTLMLSDTNSRYFTENNDDFINESSAMIREFHKNDEYFKPPMTLQTKYDLCMGSKGVYTPLRYHTYYRYFLCVNSGKIRVKMTPFKSRKYLYPIHDYDNYEFRSPVDVWKPQKKYMHEMDKLQFLEIDIIAGNVLYVPPYWWYSVQYIESNTIVSGFTYNSIMNCIANSGNWAKYFLQQSNTKQKVLKSLNIDITSTGDHRDENTDIIEDKE